MTAASIIHSRRNQVSRAHSTSLSSLPDLSDSYQMEDRSRCSSVSGLLSSNFRHPASPSSLAWTSGLSNYRAYSNASVSFLGRRITREYRSTFILSDDQTVGVTRRETFQPDEAHVDVRVNLCLQSSPEDLRDSGDCANHLRAQSEPPCRLRIRESVDDNRWARLMLTTDEPQNSELFRRFGKSYSNCQDAGRNVLKHIPCQTAEDYRLQHNFTLSESDVSTAGSSQLGSNLHSQQQFPGETLRPSPRSATSCNTSYVRPSEFSTDDSLNPNQPGIGETGLGVNDTYRQSGSYISRFPALIGSCSSVETLLSAGNAPDVSDFIETTLLSHGARVIADTIGNQSASTATSGTTSTVRRWTSTKVQQDVEDEAEDFSTVRRRPNAVQDGSEQKSPAIVLVTDHPLTPTGLDIVGSSSSFEEPSTERVEKDTCPRISRPHPAGLSGDQSHYNEKYTPEVQDSSSMWDLSLDPITFLPATDRSESFILFSRPSSVSAAAVGPSDDTVGSVSSVPVDQQNVHSSDLRLARRKSLESGQGLARSAMAKNDLHRAKCRSESAGPRSEPIGNTRGRHDSDSSTDAPTITTPKTIQSSFAQANDNSIGALEILNSSQSTSGQPPFMISVSEEKPVSDAMGTILPEDAHSLQEDLLGGCRNSSGERNTSTPDNADASTESGFIDAGVVLSEFTTCSLIKSRKEREVFESTNEKQFCKDTVQDAQPKPRTLRQQRHNTGRPALTDGSPTSAQPENASDRDRQVTLFETKEKRSRESGDLHQEGVKKSNEQQLLLEGTISVKSLKPVPDAGSSIPKHDQSLTRNQNDPWSGVRERDPEKNEQRRRGLKLSDLMLSGSSLSPYSANKHVELHTFPQVNSTAGRLVGKETPSFDFSDSHESIDSLSSSFSKQGTKNQNLSPEHSVKLENLGELHARKGILEGATDGKSPLFVKMPLEQGENTGQERESIASSSVQSSLPHLSGESGAGVFGPPDMLPLFVLSEEASQHLGHAKRKPIVGNSEWSLEDIESLSQISSEPDSSTSSVTHTLPNEGPQDEMPHKTTGPQSVNFLLPPKSRHSMEGDGKGKSAMGSMDRPDPSESRPPHTRTPCVRDSPVKESSQKNKRKPVVSPAHQEGDSSVIDATCSTFRGPFDPRANGFDFEENARAADHEMKRRRRSRLQEEEEGARFSRVGNVAVDRAGRSDASSTNQSDLGNPRLWKSKEYPDYEQSPLPSVVSSRLSGQDGVCWGRNDTLHHVEDYPDDVSVTSEEEEEVSDLDNEDDLRPPALRRDIETEIIGVPEEYSRPRRRPKLRPLQHPLYANLDEQQRIDNRVQKSRKRDNYAEPRPLGTRDQNVSESRLGVVNNKALDLPDKLVVLTRRRTMSGITGRLPPAPSTSTTSLWFGDHPVPTRTQIDAADNAPLRLSNIQLQAQAELARRKTRSFHRGHSLDRVTASRMLANGDAIGVISALGPTTSTLYGVRGKRMKGGAPLVERAIARRLSKRDGYETLSVVSIPHVAKEKSPGTGAEATAMARKKEYNVTHARDGRPRARSAVAKAAVDLAINAFDAGDV